MACTIRWLGFGLLVLGFNVLANSTSFEWDCGQYSGASVGGVPQGKGRLVCDSFIYEGDFNEGFRSGSGTLDLRRKGRYEGEILDGVAHGRGVYFLPNGARYEGDFANGKQTGAGKLIGANGNQVQGEFVDGVLTGKGTQVFVDGSRYEGDFVNNKPL